LQLALRLFRRHSHDLSRYWATAVLSASFLDIDEFGAETVELFFVLFVRFANLAYRLV